jgi:ubiquinol-cytochrome c reductase cytochrome b subunit
MLDGNVSNPVHQRRFRYSEKEGDMINATLSRMWNWLNKRWPIAPVIRWALEEDIPGGSSFAYTLGSAIIAVFLLQVTTGILQLFYYVPTVENAYNSVTFLRTKVPFGWLVNQMHRQGADFMVVLVALHLIRVFIFSAYKKPRELTWLIGVVLLMTVMALTFTGGPLPWDQKGFWEAEVGTSIPGSIPVIGGEISRIMRGGVSMGQLTLSRLFAIHVGIFPVLLAFLIVLHLISFRRSGSVGPWDESKRNVTGSFWPDQVFKDTIISIIVILVLITLCVFTPKPFYGPADPLDSSFTPKPEWNFLFLYQALKYFHGTLEPVGVVGVPTFFIVLMLLLPFIDRRAERNPKRRPVAMICGVLFASAITALTFIGYFSSPGVAPATPPPMKAEKTAVPESVKKGEQLFHSTGCGSCHRVNGKGGTIGPDLSNEGQIGHSRKWLVTQIRNPKAYVPDSIMPPFTSPSDQEVKYLVDYLLNLKTGMLQSSAGPLKKQPTAAVTASEAEKGKALFNSQGCSGCHKINGIGGSLGPDLSDEGKKGRSSQWLKEQIRNPKSHFPNSVMPSFSALSDREMSNLVDYLMTLGTGNNQSSVESKNAGKDPPALVDNSSAGSLPASSAHQQSRTSKNSSEEMRPGQAAYIIGNAGHGADIFKQKCESCHGTEGTDKIPNPGSDDRFVPALNPIDPELFSKYPETFAEKIDMFIQHGSTPDGPNPQFHMLAFGDEHTLTQQQIANIEAYILQLNGINRAEIINPGMKPKRFFFIVIPVFVIILLLLGGIYRCLPHSGRPEGKE